MTIEKKYIQHVEKCFEDAIAGKSKISQDIIDMEGMTGTKTRHLYNNLLSMDSVRYLEIGTWKGSSSCAALFGNKVTATLIDNFSSFGSPREEFFKNIEKYKGENDVTVLEEDCFNVDVDKIGQFNIYLADGDHSEESHFRFINKYIPCLDDVFILIIDDWNWDNVRSGTKRGIET